MKPKPHQKPVGPVLGHKRGWQGWDESARERAVAAFLAAGGAVRRIEGCSYVSTLDRATPGEQRARTHEPAPR